MWAWHVVFYSVVVQALIPGVSAFAPIEVDTTAGILIV